MKSFRNHENSLLVSGLLFPTGETLSTYISKIESLWGPKLESSEPVPFQSQYYQKEMGSLQRCFILFERTVFPDALSKFKVQSIELESQFQQGNGGRRLNLDPGYLNLYQLVLATSKPYSHRIYLREGIWADLTLIYQSGSYQSLPWTYPDYADNISLFNGWREKYRSRLFEEKE